MSTQPFHYEVRINFQVSKNNITDEEELETFEKKFSEDTPINNRIEALRYFESYIENLVERIGEEYIDFETAEMQLEKLYYPKTETKSNILDAETIPDRSGKYLGVFIIINDPINDDDIVTNKLRAILPGIADAHMIHGFPCNAQSILWNLQTELDYYNHYQLDKGGLEASTLFYDEEEKDTCSYSFLKTPFEWKGLDVPPDNLSEETTDEILKYIENGECQNVEFKSSLVYNFKTGKGGISVKEKIAKSICAFLNSSNNSVLLIGVRDDKSIQGLNHDFSLSNKPDEKDFFRLEFSELLQRFFEHSIRNFITNGFIEVHNKLIFVVGIKPASRPVFMKASFKNSEGNWIEELQFYYRSESSSMQIKDVKEIVQYCLDRFGNANE